MCRCWFLCGLWKGCEVYKALSPSFFSRGLKCPDQADRQNTGVRILLVLMDMSSESICLFNVMPFDMETKGDAQCFSIRYHWLLLCLKLCLCVTLKYTFCVTSWLRMKEIHQSSTLIAVNFCTFHKDKTVLCWIKLKKVARANVCSMSVLPLYSFAQCPVCKGGRCSNSQKQFLQILKYTVCTKCMDSKQNNDWG